MNTQSPLNSLYLLTKDQKIDSFFSDKPHQLLNYTQSQSWVGTVKKQDNCESPGVGNFCGENDKMNDQIKLPTTDFQIAFYSIVIYLKDKKSTKNRSDVVNKTIFRACRQFFKFKLEEIRGKKKSKNKPEILQSFDILAQNILNLSQRDLNIKKKDLANHIGALIMPRCIQNLDYCKTTTFDENEPTGESYQRKKTILWISESSHRVLYRFNKRNLEYFLLSPENIFLLNYFLGLASVVYAPNGPLENLFYNQNTPKEQLNLFLQKRASVLSGDLSDSQMTKLFSQSSIQKENKQYNSQRASQTKEVLPFEEERFLIRILLPKKTEKQQFEINEEECKNIEIQTIKNFGRVVDSLFNKTQSLINEKRLRERIFCHIFEDKTHNFTSKKRQKQIFEISNIQIF